MKTSTQFLIIFFRIYYQQSTRVLLNYKFDNSNSLYCSLYNDMYITMDPTEQIQQEESTENEVNDIRKEEKTDDASVVRIQNSIISFMINS